MSVNPARDCPRLRSSLGGFSQNKTLEQVKGFYFGDPAAVARCRSGLSPPPVGVVNFVDRTRPAFFSWWIFAKQNP